MSSLIHRRVEQARRGENRKAICRVRSGWVVLGDIQVLHGYCLLIADPIVEDLNRLTLEERAIFLLDMSLLGDALLEVTGAERINYEILGNSHHALHAHVFPRYENEPKDLRHKPAWYYDKEKARRFDPEIDGPLMAKIAHALERLGGQYQPGGYRRA